jgi:hypothetical protein
MMHGLGFISAWGDYLTPNDPTILTPQVALGNPTSQSAVQFEGFVEYAYDRLMSFPAHPGLYATNLTQDLVKDFASLGYTFNSTSDLAQSFLESPAKNIAISMDGNATTHGAIVQSLPVPVATNGTFYYPPNVTAGPTITLETSFNPFQAGSSLNHVDGAMYLSTPDFLMRYSTPMGKTLQDLIIDYGSEMNTTYGPFGPGLRYILGGIGYRIRGGIPLGGSTPNAVSNVSGGSGGSATTTTGSSPDTKSGATRGLVLEMGMGSWGVWVFGWVLGLVFFV